MTQKDKKLILAELFNRCWDDEAYKAQFVENPAKILAEAGIPVDAEKNYRVVENTADIRYIILPEKDAAAVFEQFKNLAAKRANLIPAGKEIRFVQNSDAAQYIILPPKPSEELTDEELDAVAGGAFISSLSNAFTTAQVATHVQTVTEFEVGVAVEVSAVVVLAVVLV